MKACPICNKPLDGKSFHDWKKHSDHWQERQRNYYNLNQAVRKAFNTMAERGLDFDFMRELAEHTEVLD